MRTTDPCFRDPHFELHVDQLSLALDTQVLGLGPIHAAIKRLRESRPTRSGVDIERRAVPMTTLVG